MNAALLPAVIGLLSGAAALPPFPTGLVLLGDSLFSSRAKIMNVIFLRENTASPQWLLFLLHAITQVSGDLCLSI